MAAKARVAVMLSGNGTTMSSLLFHSRLPGCPYEIVLSRIFSPEDTYRDSPGFVGWIKHLHEKSWGHKSMSDFVDAVLTIGRHGYMHGQKHVRVWQHGTSEGECRLVEQGEVQ